MQEKIFSVTALGNIIKKIFDFEELLQGIKVTGEISGYYVVRGIAYFSIKDETAVLPCVLFGAELFRSFKDGDQVVLTGSPKFYVKGGKLSFNASNITLAGSGDLFKQFLIVKEKLEKEGLFNVDIKKKITPPYKRIGVVSSPTGAVIQDIINVVTRRDIQSDIVLYPVKVQGTKAELEIAKGINFFSNYNVDVVIVARGGGSLEDLNPFNTEVVARAIFACEKPVVSAVGHETDFTICDFASDLRAPTPSAAAELTTINRNEQRNHFFNQIERFNNVLDKLTERKKQNFNFVANKMENIFNKNVTKKQTIVFNQVQSFKRAVSSFLENKSFALSMASNSLERVDQKAILSRGFAKIRFGDKNISSVDGMEIGNNVKIDFIDGSLDTTVNNIERRKV
ncbi:MAG: exodeoxyribonuclease VII large subunit [Clostridia bacterium]